MVIDFVMVILLFLYVMLILSFIIKNSTIAFITSMGLIVCAIYMHVNGFGELNNFLTSSFALITLGVGFYVLLRTSIEEVQNGFSDL